MFLGRKKMVRKHEMKDFEESQAFDKIKEAFAISSITTKSKSIPGHGICKFKYNDQGDITEVSFRNYDIKNLPESITSLSKLEKLIISKSVVKYKERNFQYIQKKTKSNAVPISITLPNNFGDLKNLKHLDFTRNLLGLHESNGSFIAHRVGVLPDSFGELINLQTVTFKSCLLFDLPDSFRNLQNLLSLDLSWNSFTSFPQVITELKNLKVLNFAGLFPYFFQNTNYIKILPGSIEKLTNLLILNLRRNELKNLPDSIGNLKNLRTLYVDKCNLKFLPDTIGKLRNLQVLNVDGNRNLQTLPESMDKLRGLQKLFLGGTGILNLPENLTKLSNLTTIGLSLNQIKSFSKFAMDFPKLKKIIIYPMAYVTYGWDKRLNYYPPVEKISKLHSISVQRCLKELKNNGCLIQMYIDES